MKDVEQQATILDTLAEDNQLVQMYNVRVASCFIWGTLKDTCYLEGKL